MWVPQKQKLFMIYITCIRTVVFRALFTLMDVIFVCSEWLLIVWLLNADCKEWWTIYAQGLRQTSWDSFQSWMRPKKNRGYRSLLISQLLSLSASSKRENTLTLTSSIDTQTYGQTMYMLIVFGHKRNKKWARILYITVSGKN